MMGHDVFAAFAAELEKVGVAIHVPAGARGAIKRVAPRPKHSWADKMRAASYDVAAHDHRMQMLKARRLKNGRNPSSGIKDPGGAEHHRAFAAENRKKSNALKDSIGEDEKRMTHLSPDHFKGPRRG
jgi:hypothetical protein